MLVKNNNFCPKSKFLIDILLKKSTFLSKVDILLKKSTFCSKIDIFVEDLHVCQKSTYLSKLENFVNCVSKLCDITNRYFLAGQNKTSLRTFQLAF